MDPNLLHWRYEGRSFFHRLQTWSNLVDPALLLYSDPEIQKAHSLIGSSKPQDKKDESALNLSLSSVHADSGVVLPIFFRPPAFYPMTLPFVLGSFLPHIRVKYALFWQMLLQSYCAGFNHANRNSSAEQDKKTSLKQLLLITGTVSSASCAGALPQIFVNRLNIRSPPAQMFFRTFLPMPLSAVLAFFNVYTIRSEELETGIQVFDRNGNPVGISKAAAEKAVVETAFSRMMLFGMTAAVSNLLISLLHRIRRVQKNPLLAAHFGHTCFAFVLALMVPVSFSLFPQLGTIKREMLEKELQDRAISAQLFYHRGL